MIDKFQFAGALINKRFIMVVMTATALGGVIITAASPASAIGPSWTEQRRGCSYTREWRVVSGTCKTVLGVKVPCPLRQKACQKDYCTQVSY
jgi:hypothetical protein